MKKLRYSASLKVKASGRARTGAGGRPQGGQLRSAHRQPDRLRALQKWQATCCTGDEEEQPEWAPGVTPRPLPPLPANTRERGLGLFPPSACQPYRETQARLTCPKKRKGREGQTVVDNERLRKPTRRLRTRLHAHRRRGSAGWRARRTTGSLPPHPGEKAACPWRLAAPSPRP